MSKITETHLSVAIAAVARACAVTRAVQQNLASLDAVAKDDKSPVTVADFAAQAVIAHDLAVAGDYDMVAEESSTLLRADGDGALLEAVTGACRTVWPDAGPEAVLAAIDRGDHDASAGAYWTLDPVDGTKGFLRGGQYAVSLAYIEAGKVTLGVLGCPNLSADFEQSFDSPDHHGQVYSAVRGAGAFCVPADRPGSAPARVTVAGSDAGAIRVCESVESGHSRQDMTRDVVAALGGAGAPARLDSQCKYAVVARGQADAYLRLPTRKGYQEKIWDHAAGKLVAEEAGALVSDISGAPLDFSHGATLSANRGVVCATPAWHGRIIDAIAKLDLAAD